MAALTANQLLETIEPRLRTTPWPGRRSTEPQPMLGPDFGRGLFLRRDP